MKKIEMYIQCPHCKGTGVYSGVGESNDTAVICHSCYGSGKYLFKYEYEEFTGIKIKEDIKRVYLTNYGYKIGTGIVDFKDFGIVNMDEKGVSYSEFLNGKMPEHIEEISCPLLADQGACHKIKGFVNRCNSFNDGWLNLIYKCKNKLNAKECWKIFKSGVVK